MDLSIVIVNFNTRELTKQTVDYVCRSVSDLEYEIIIADNSTSRAGCYDETDDRVKLIKGLPNKGFGNACNIGAEKAIGRYVLFLNSDTIVQKSSLEKCVKYMDEHHDVGLSLIHILLLASCEARSISLLAPVVIKPNSTSSALRPARSTTISESISSLVIR